MSEILRIPELNKAIVVGRVTKDLELRFTPANQAVCTFSIATNRNFKDSQTGEWKEITSFLSIVVWGKQAEVAADRLKKGSAVYVEGRLQSRNWETKQGEKRSTIEIIADRLQFLTRLENQDKSGIPGNQSHPASSSTSKSDDKAWDVEGSIESLDDEIPF